MMVRGDVICQAIEAKAILSFYYEGGQRVVEPYLFGVDAAGRHILIGYQIRGYSESVKFPPWRSFELWKVRNLELIDEPPKIRDVTIPDNFKLKEKICWRD